MKLKDYQWQKKIFKTKNEKNKTSLNNDIKEFGDFTNKKNKYVKVLKVVMIDY